MREEKVGWCWNSRQWVDFMVILPHSCPQCGFQGNRWCANDGCGYYEERKPSPWYKEKLNILQEAK